MSLLLSHLKKLAADQPEHVLLENGQGQRWTASEVDQIIQAISQQLLDSGCHRIGLFADNGPDWLWVDLAALAAGIVLVPLPGFFTRNQLQYICDQAGLDGVIAPTAMPPHWTDLSPTPIDGSKLFLWRRGHNTDLPALPDGTVKITFTSGSTGHPKGVCLSLSNQEKVAASLAEVTCEVRGNRHLCLLPLATLLENVAGCYRGLLQDHCTVIPNLDQIGLTGSSQLNIHRFCSAFNQYQPSSVILTPELLRALMMAIESGWKPPQSLQFIAVGGARVAPSLLEKTRSLGLPAYEGYGLSECGSVVSLNVPSTEKPGSAGRVLPHCQIKIVNGEIQVHGNAFLGYLGDTLQPSPEIATGDLGHIDSDGFLHIDGRRKNLLITSYGRNVAPEWIESELLTEPSIGQCIVLGDGKPGLSALIWSPDIISNDQIGRSVTQVNARLPDYARVYHWLRLEHALTSRQGMLTANGRPRRQLIARNYDRQISKLHDPDLTSEAY